MDLNTFGLLAGLAVAALVGLLVLWRPLLARIALEMAKARPRQVALIVVGLMVATTVVASSGLASDSASDSFIESLSLRQEGVDATVEAIFDPIATEAEDVVVAQMSEVRSASGVVEARMPLENSAGLGDQQTPVWGIDPDAYRSLVPFRVVDGSVAGRWTASDIVLDESLAFDLAVEVGDAMHLYIPAVEVEVRQEQTLDGHFELAFASPTLVDGGAPTYFHHPDDIYRFEYEVGPGFREAEFLVTSPDADIVVNIDTPVGRWSNQTLGREAHIRIFYPDPEVAGTWNITVQSPQAQDADFTIEAWHTEDQILDSEVLPMRVKGIVEDEGAMPLRQAGNAFVERGHLQEWMRKGDTVDALVMGLEPGTDLEELDKTFEDRVEDLLEVRFAWTRLTQLENERLAEDVKTAVGATFLGMGSFTILAGFMLAAVLVALLVEERRRLLATKRAIGARRGDVRNLLTMEGAAYAVLAGIAGLLAAGLVALLIVAAAQSIFTEEGVTFRLTVKGATILAAVGLGFALTVAAIAFSAHRAAKLQVVHALRGEPDDRHHGRRGAIVWGGILLVVGAAWLILAPGQSLLTLSLAPVLIIVGAGILMVRLLHLRFGTPLAAAAILAYTATSFFFLSPITDLDFLSFPLRGVVMALAGGVLAASAAPLHALVARLFSRAPGGPIFPTAIGHMAQRPGRASLTIGMLATVLAILTALGTMFAMFDPNSLGDAGGYTVVADMADNIDDPLAYLGANPPLSGIDPFAHVDGWAVTGWIPNGGSYRIADPDHTASGYSWSWRGEDLIALSEPFRSATEFEVRGGGDSKELFARVLADPTKVVASSGVQVFYFGSSNEDGDPPPDRRLVIGDTISWNLGGGEYRNASVIGLVDGVGVAGFFAHPDLVEDVANDDQGRPSGTRIWAVGDGTVSDQVLAQELEAGFRRAGAEATVVAEADAEEGRIQNAIQIIITVFIGLGVVLGMVALALIMNRNVLVRRAEIGALRAIGASKTHILAMFFAETLYVAGSAILIGLGVGLLLAFAMFRIDFVPIDFTVDWVQLGWLYLVTTAAAVAAAWFPAWLAARMPPAQAVRHTE